MKCCLSSLYINEYDNIPGTLLKKKKRLPLSYPEVSRWAATHITPICIGTAKAAWSLGRTALIDIMARTSKMFKLESCWAYALEAPQCVVTCGSSAHVAAHALVLICKEHRTNAHYNLQVLSFAKK